MTAPTQYAMAEYTDCDTGEVCFAIPDLGVDVTALTRAEALLDRYMAVRTALAGRPPAPRPIDVLQALHPSLMDWEWSLITVRQG